MAVAAKAQFAPDPQRRALIAKVHIAPKQLGMQEDDYRGLMRRVTGQISARDCTVPQLQALVAEFTRLGFSAAPRKTRSSRPGQPRRADHPVARKARALWISLGYLCAIDDPSEKALERFATRQLKCTAFQWADQSQCDRLIEALKAMAERHGWRQSLAGLGKAHHVHALKMRLADAILVKLKRAAIVPSGWNLGRTAWHLCKLSDPDQRLFATGDLDAINARLGAKLRALGGEDAFKEMQA